jgi:TRAP-type C4-dicarboxylate transport system permease small subunit
MLTWFIRLLAGITILLLVVLAGVVLFAVASRTAGSSPVWYDEVASVLLAWLSLLGAALATARNAHLNFEGLLMSLPSRLRTLAFIVGEAVFYATFAIVLWFGWKLLAIFGDETMTSLPAVPLSIVQSIVPLGAVLIVIARLLVTPGNWARVQAGTDLESQEIAAEIERARTSMAQAGFDTRA